MSLSLKDRVKGVIRCFKIFADPKTDYVNFMWCGDLSDEQADSRILTHTFYAEGTNPTDPLLVYMAQVAGKSETIELMNERAEFYLNKVCVAHKHFNPSLDTVLHYIGQPIRGVPKNQTTISEDTDPELSKNNEIE